MQYDRCVDIVTSLAARYQNARLERIGYQEQADAMAGNDFPASRPGIPNALWGRYVQGAQSVAQGLVRKLEATEVDLLAKVRSFVPFFHPSPFHSSHDSLFHTGVRLSHLRLRGSRLVAQAKFNVPH